MKTVNYHIPTISCKHCVMTIKRELSDLNGVESVQGELETQDISVTFGSPATEDAIQALLAEIGYPVQK